MSLRPLLVSALLLASVPAAAEEAAGPAAPYRTSREVLPGAAGPNRLDVDASLLAGSAFRSGPGLLSDLRLVAGDGFGPASRGQIEKLVRDTFGPAVRFDVELVDAIPQEPSGKYRFCISKPARDYLQALSA